MDEYRALVRMVVLAGVVLAGGMLTLGLDTGGGTELRCAHLAKLHRYSNAHSFCLLTGDPG